MVVARCCMQTFDEECIVEDDRRFSLQFIVYGAYYAVISVLFLVRGTYTACVNQRNPGRTETKEQESSVEVIAAERF